MVLRKALFSLLPYHGSSIPGGSAIPEGEHEDAPVILDLAEGPPLGPRHIPHRVLEGKKERGRAR